MKYLPLLIGSMGLAALGACTAQQITKSQTDTTAAVSHGVVQGQLFCAKAAALGPLVLAVVQASTKGEPVLATGATAEFVNAICASIGGIPVAPPPNPADAPVVAVVAPVATP